MTRPIGLTMPADYCFRCHAKIAEERPSHVGLTFQTCNASGCHNFHDNRALYKDFLVKHANGPDLSAILEVPQRDFAVRYQHDHPQRPRQLTMAQHDGPTDRTYAAALMTEWVASTHARAGVNCRDCHVNPAAGPQWVEHPTPAACGTCHQVERDGFLHGRHGMRLDQGLSPMTPGMARPAMKTDAGQQTVDLCVVPRRPYV